MNHFELAPEQWATLRQLLDEALDRPQQERATWLEQLDPQFDAFKPRLRSLLEHAAKATRALPINTLPKVETAQFLADRTTRPQSDGAPQAGDSVGPYRLVRPLGEGGMGSVWLAERSDMLVKRQVALKLPHLAWRRARLAERLEREREILAALNHPNIARLYDAGISADRQPFLALEYVEGERIDAYCTRKTLDVPARLRLFLQVARAVAHAHANLIVHRDLKPTNILVTEAGEVKLLDFGIAKLLEDGRAQETELTQIAGRALTPDYAAPEQILGQPIGTAADVYALGVVLFELLTGTRPYQLKRDSRAALEEAIVQADVSRPSAVAADAKLKKRLRGDLDTIVLRALKKLPAERYGTVDALADDIERHLDRRPVRAQADSRVYRLSKFIARNLLAVGAVASVLLATLVGLGAALWQAQVASRERDFARQEQRRAEEVKGFVLSIFRDAGPQNQTGRVPSSLELLKLAKNRIDQIDPKWVEVRVEMLGLLGDSMLMLDDAKTAESVLKQAISEAHGGLGDKHKMVLWAKSMLAQSYRRQSRPLEMRAVLEDIVPVLRRRQSELPNQYLAALVNLANLSSAEYRLEERQQVVDEALRFVDMRFGGRHINKSLLLTHRAHYLGDRGQFDEAVDTANEAVDAALSMNRNDRQHAMVLNARHGRAGTLGRAGRLDEALREFEEVLVDTEHAFSGRTRAFGQRLAGAAPVFAHAGVLDRALSMADEAVQIMSRYQEPDSQDLANARVARGQVLLTARRGSRASDEFAHALGVLQPALAPDHGRIRSLQHDYALALAYGGHIGDAVAIAEVTDLPSSAMPREEVERAALHRARVFRLAGRPHEAIKSLSRWRASLVDQTRKHEDAAVSPLVRDPMRLELALAQLDAGLPIDAAAELTKLAPSGAARLPDDADLLVAVARVALVRGDALRALESARRADSFWRRHEPGSRWAGEAALWLARSHEALGQSGEATAAFARATAVLAKSPTGVNAKLPPLARGR
jgi:serine/threonine-protein kinase